MDKVNEIIDDMYRIASKKKYRFEVIGSFFSDLTVEELWDLEINKLRNLALNLYKECESYKKGLDLDITSNYKSDMKLKFCIVVDILRNRMKEEHDIFIPNEKEILNIKISKN